MIGLRLTGSAQPQEVVEQLKRIGCESSAEPSCVLVTDLKDCDRFLGAASSRPDPSHSDNLVLLLPAVAILQLAGLKLPWTRLVVSHPIDDGRFAALLQGLESSLGEAPDSTRCTISVSSASEEVRAAVEYVMSAITCAFGADASPQWLKLAIDELVRNAFEHGNLAISSAEKAAFLETGNFEAELAIRSERPEIRAKRILINLELSRTGIVLSVEDEGAGFDWKAVTQRTIADLDVSQPLGRGVPLAMKVFDTVSYNERGNAVRVEKQLRN